MESYFKLRFLKFGKGENVLSVTVKREDLFLGGEPRGRTGGNEGTDFYADFRSSQKVLVPFTF